MFNVMWPARVSFPPRSVSVRLPAPSASPPRRTAQGHGRRQGHHRGLQGTSVAAVQSHTQPVGAAVTQAAQSQRSASLGQEPEHCR